MKQERNFKCPDIRYFSLVALICLCQFKIFSQTPCELGLKSYHLKYINWDSGYHEILMENQWNLKYEVKKNILAMKFLPLLDNELDESGQPCYISFSDSLWNFLCDSYEDIPLDWYWDKESTLWATVDLGPESMEYHFMTINNNFMIVKVYITKGVNSDVSGPYKLWKYYYFERVSE